MLPRARIRLCFFFNTASIFRKEGNPFAASATSMACRSPGDLSFAIASVSLIPCFIPEITSLLVAPSGGCVQPAQPLLAKLGGKLRIRSQEPINHLLGIELH